MKIGKVAGFPDKYRALALAIILLFVYSIGVSQTYNPSLHSVSNKAIGIAQATPVDARSQFYDQTNFVYRDYQSVNECWSYLNLPKYRAGHFPLFVHVGGILGGNGIFVGGFTNVYWFKDSTGNSNLVRWYTDSTGIAGGPLFAVANNLSEGVPATIKTNLSLNNVDNTSDATKNSASVTLTNHIISGALNTFSNIPNSALANNSIGLSIGTSGTDIGVTTTPAALGSSLVIQIPSAGVGSRGALTASDWNKFSNKLDSTSINSGDSVYDWSNGTPTLRYVIAAPPGTGITTLNGLTATVQVLGTGTSGTDFNINSTTATHTFNFPNCSGTNRGLLTSTDWSTFNNKQAALSGTGYLNFTGTTPSYFTPTQVTADLNVFTSTLKGLAPLSGGGTTNFLRADGTWAAPPGGGSVTLTNAHIFVGSAGNVATDVALSGDIGITNAGLSTIQANAVTTGKIINNAVTYGKIQAASGASLLGATGAGNFGEITLGTGLSFAGSVLNAAAGGATNSNVGAGYRFAVPTTNNIKTFFTGPFLQLDSASNANALTLKMATNTANTLFGYDASGNPVDVTAGTGISINAGSISSTAITPTFQQTLTQGNALTKGDTINLASHDLTVTGGGNFIHDSIFITNNSNLLLFGIPDSASAYGNSFTVPQGLTAALGWANLYATYLNKPITNHAVSSTGAYLSSTSHLANINFGHTALTATMFGLNDVRYGASSVTSLIPVNTTRKICNALNAIFLNQYAATLVKADSTGGVVTRYGTWTSYNSNTYGGKSGTHGSYTTNLNDSLVYTFSGTSVGIGLIGTDSSSTVRYSESMQFLIDQTLIKTISEDNQYDGVSVNSHADIAGPMAVWFTGLSSGAHTLKIINKTTHSYPMVIDYLTTLVDPTKAMPWVLMEVPKLTATGYTTVPNGANDSIINTLNRSIDSTKALFPSSFPVRIGQTNTSWKTVNSQSDSIHPNALGQRQLDTAAINALSVSQIGGVTGSTQVGQLSRVGDKLIEGTSTGPQIIAYLSQVPGGISGGVANYLVKYATANTSQPSTMQDSSGFITTTEPIFASSARVKIGSVAYGDAPLIAGVLATTTFPYLGFNSTAAATDNKKADIYVDGTGILHHRFVTDAGVGKDWLTVTHAGNVVSEIDMQSVTGWPNSPTAPNNVGYIGMSSDFMVSGINRNPVTGVINQTGKAAVQVALKGANGDGEFQVYTTNTNNSAPVQNMTLFGSGNLALGTTTDAATAIFNLTSTTKGFLPPRMTLAQATAISSPATSLHFVITDSSGKLALWNGTKIVTYATTDQLGSGGGAVSSVSNSDGTLTISPTTGAVIASLALAHANTWTGVQTQPAPIFTGLTSSGANDSVLTVDPSTGQVHRRSGIFNLYAANGLSTSTVIVDTFYLGGTLNQTTSIAGAGFAMNLGTSGSHLGDFNIYSDGGTLISNGSYQSAQGSQLLGAASTINNAVTSASGTVSNFSAYALLAPTVTSTNASITYNNAATLRIDNSPTMSTNSTATGFLYALDVAAGISHFGVGSSSVSAIFDGEVAVAGASVTNTQGLSIGAPTTTRASLNLASAADPTSGGVLSNPGNMWFNGTNLFFVDGGTQRRDILNGIHNYLHTIFTPTTGGTVSLLANQYNIINPAGALVALTVNLPSSPANNDVVYIKFTQTVSTVTYGNGTVVDGITAPTAGGMTVLTYDQSTSSWY